MSVSSCPFSSPQGERHPLLTPRQKIHGSEILAENDGQRRICFLPDPFRRLVLAALAAALAAATVVVIFLTSAAVGGSRADWWFPAHANHVIGKVPPIGPSSFVGPITTMGIPDSTAARDQEDKQGFYQHRRGEQSQQNYSCHGGPCFVSKPPRHDTGSAVARGVPGFPSFLDRAGAPMNVTYDGRSFFLDGDRVLFLGGSMHPVRATPRTWELALDQAVRAGLNLITIYVMWSAHQSSAASPMDWSFDDSDGGNSLRRCANTSTATADHEDDGDQDASAGAGACRDDGGGGWNLAAAISAAASRGLFIHARIGPYVCAEYSYGGIPEWLPVEYPDMVMRRPDANWLRVTERYVSDTIDYLSRHHLWAHQGGPIIMGQIENELGSGNGVAGEQQEEEHFRLKVDLRGRFVDPEERYESRMPTPVLRNATIQDYANWCGDLVAQLAPDVVWTMCSGLSANNTILTFNGEDGTGWLQARGGQSSGRIQMDQPAMWTEHEGGFQMWGEEPYDPSTYFWGRTAAVMASHSLRWLARGGTHVNYYMWWGGYNRGRAAASGIMNAYATDAPTCSSGEPRQPKFDHFAALHAAVRDAAPVLLHAPTQLGKDRPVEVLTDRGTWEVGTEQRMFVYRASGKGAQEKEALRRRLQQQQQPSEVVFIENDAKETRTVRVPAGSSGGKPGFTLQGQSSVLVLDGSLVYDSSAVQPRAKKYRRRVVTAPAQLLDEKVWAEPVGTRRDDTRTELGDEPVEQTALNVGWGLSSDYAWYETDFSVDEDRPEKGSVSSWSLLVNTKISNAFVAFVDGVRVGAADDHQQGESDCVLTIPLGGFGNRGAINSPGKTPSHRLALLSESLGYSNLLGLWGASTGPKTKGITGDVVLVKTTQKREGKGRMKKRSLVDGREWRSFAGLHGERPFIAHEERKQPGGQANRRKEGRNIYNHTTQLLQNKPYGDGSAVPTWSSRLFDTPLYDPTFQSLFVEIVSGRGHMWLNGNDLGRYWNITRSGSTAELSQRYYFLPPDYLHPYGAAAAGRRNELVLFDAFGGHHRDLRLVLSWTEPTDDPCMEDEVDFASACL